MLAQIDKNYRHYGLTKVVRRPGSYSLLERACRLGFYQ
jgi:hypothetical protein